MDATFATWLVILLAIAGANLPFVNQQLFGVIALRAGGVWRKPWSVRLLEMIVCYLLIGAASFALEARLGNRFPQTWEFYAITGCMFIVLAFPGYVVRYLRKQH